MSLLTRPDGTPNGTYTREKEIRALAVQAAATLFASRTTERTKYGVIGAVLEHARTIEGYIERGEIPQDRDA